jgi:hypothetical protein
MRRPSDQRTRRRLDALEREARQYPRLHRVRLTWAILLGYAYPLLLVVLGFWVVVGLIAAAPLVWGLPDWRA